MNLWRPVLEEEGRKDKDCDSFQRSYESFFQGKRMLTVQMFQITRNQIMIIQWT